MCNGDDTVVLELQARQIWKQVELKPRGKKTNFRVDKKQLKGY